MPALDGGERRRARILSLRSSRRAGGVRTPKRGRESPREPLMPLLLGLALLLVRMWQSDQFALNALLLIGVPGIALGAGFLISAAISYRLSKSLIFDDSTMTLFTL